MRFGTSKEELRELNVIVNHSCHEIPSQTYEDSGKNETNIEVDSSRSLWSDEFDDIQTQIGTTITTGDKENEGNMQVQLPNTSNPNATINPRALKTRVDSNMSFSKQQPIQPDGDNKGTPK